MNCEDVGCGCVRSDKGLEPYTKEANDVVLSVFSSHEFTRVLALKLATRAIQDCTGELRDKVVAVSLGLADVANILEGE